MVIIVGAVGVGEVRTPFDKNHRSGKVRSGGGVDLCGGGVVLGWAKQMLTVDCWITFSCKKRCNTSHITPLFAKLKNYTTLSI